jgi:hypothetical protein
MDKLAVALRIPKREFSREWTSSFGEPGCRSEKHVLPLNQPFTQDSAGVLTVVSKL